MKVLFTRIVLAVTVSSSLCRIVLDALTLIYVVSSGLYGLHIIVSWELWQSHRLRFGHVSNQGA